MAQLPVRLRLRRLICQNIVDGVWPPGSRLPGRERLARTYRVSLRSLQTCIDDLQADGHVVSHGGHGTLIAERPPCLYDYLLVCDEESAAGLASNLRRSAEAWPGEQRFRSRKRVEIDGVVADLQNHRVAGALILGEVQDVEDELRHALAALPVALIAFLSKEFPRLHLDLYESLHWAIDQVHNAGYQRVAIINGTRPSRKLRQRLQQWLHRRGMSVDLRYLHEVPLSAPHEAEAIMELLLSLPPAQQPEALLIGDDHLVPTVTRVLSRRENLSPAIAVWAHANHPRMSKSLVPAVRYGFRAQDILGHGLELIKTHGQIPAPVRTLTPQILERPE